MSTASGRPYNSASDNAQVGVQGQYVTIEGDVKVTAAPDESPDAKYNAGVENLKCRNPSQAREYIWQAMMDWETMPDGRVTSEVLFHWLVAMLSGRTVRQFSGEEIDQLRHFRSRYAGNGSDEWARGVRLVYQLLDSVLRSPAERDRPKIGMSLLISQFDDLGKKQRDLLRPLDLFLSGPRKDEMWRDELERAQNDQHSVDRLTRAWMFFHPAPAKVILSEPQLGPGSASGRRWMPASMILFAALAGYLALELLRQGAVLGLLGYVVGLVGGIAAAAAGLESRPWTERPPSQSAAPPDDDRVKDLAEQIDKRFQKYFDRCEPVEITRKRWEYEVAEIRRSRRDEIIGICRTNGFSAEQVAWLIRHEVRQLNQRWRDGVLRIHPQQPPSRQGAVAAHRAGLAVFVLGLVFSVFTVRAHLLGYAIVLLSAIWARHRWLMASLELRRDAAEKQERDRRQADIDEAYRRWSARLQARPKDAQMAMWLESDRMVLLGTALDYFRMPRSRLVAHGFLEKPAPGAKRSQIKGGLPRYQRYQTWIFLLAEDGVHQLRASLDFLTGTLVEREHISYGYTSIAAVRMLRKSGGVRTFELSLTAGEPIRVRVREADSGPVPQDEHDENADPADENKPATEDSDLDVASVTNTLRLLQGVAGGGKKWLHEHNWTNAWAGSQAV